eukprot:6178290-Pleurochrysis_carterae.AAC.1
MISVSSNETTLKLIVMPFEVILNARRSAKMPVTIQTSLGQPRTSGKICRVVYSLKMRASVHAAILTTARSSRFVNARNSSQSELQPVYRTRTCRFVDVQNSSLSELQPVPTTLACYLADSKEWRTHLGLPTSNIIILMLQEWSWK